MRNYGGTSPPQAYCVDWLVSKDLKSFPDDAKRAIGFALDQAQRGGKARSAKPLSGFGSASVLEIIQDYDTDTFRAVYTVRFGDFIYVLHAFQKKSKKGHTTPRADIALIRARLKMAQENYKHLVEDEKSKKRDGDT